jgi:superfamily II DNA or RNA helicase
MNLDENISKKCLFLVNGLLRTGSKRTIVYLKYQSECEEYKNILNQIMEKYHYFNIWIESITSNTSSLQRKEILSNFEEDNEEEIKKIILSIRILDEGIDIPKCDSIFITYLGDTNNDIRNTQRIMRSNRLDITNPNKISNIFIWSEDNKTSLFTFKLLKSNDINFDKKINIKTPTLFFIECLVNSI